MPRTEFPRVADFYEGKTILLTGASGYLGVEANALGLESTESVIGDVLPSTSSYTCTIMRLKEAIIRASQGNEITKIWTDSLSSLMAVFDPHTPHRLVRDIQSLLTQNRNILVRWIKAHAGYRGNEADTLAKKVITEGIVMKALNPRCELKHLQELFFKKWQSLWDNGNIGRSVHKVLKTVHLKSVF
ncbi:hypothetical protein AVEN_220858-1 [Araneus ventricosus]|uniref:Uncharacterized protein n=1 Tax=Araneus ventricosus TaxID=182803 RepID=A0A4Y2P5T9_ARAVE|nr:hypothetical protein AVEN_105185-1 [Araneus ventricosus]GBN46671.1 hypothetical protein AVEN_220858-1 [Araneus ventricosus]